MSNLWEAFVSVVQADPGAVALILPDSQVSFGELEALADRCAAGLRNRGTQRRDVVALQLPKRRESYALLLACLRLGVPYVFVDPKNPPARTERILDRIRPRVLFTCTDTANAHGERIHLPSAESGAEWLHALPPTGPPPDFRVPVTGTDPAYIMFTSGSTGEPKGAVIPHQGVLNLMAWSRTQVCAPRGARFTAVNPLHFDNSVFDIYCGLLNGAGLVPIETAKSTNPVAWVKAIRSGAATVVFAVPTLFLVLDQLGLLTPTSLPSVKVFVFGGEGYPIARLRDFHARFAGHAKLINVYGPTETSCICTSLEIDPAALRAPDSEFPALGRIHDTAAYTILDADLQPVSAGDVGELWIGGPGVGLGYYANPDETARRFRQDPRQDRYRSMWYRSGDLVREDTEGLLWFRGRVDNQVKVRGHRIELEEIDRAIQAVPGVRRAVAVALRAVEGGELSAAFVADRRIGAEEVFAVCRRMLPPYMQPARVFQLEHLPQNGNGKLDRAATRVLLERMATAPAVSGPS